ncbi:hypothetical protein HY970_00965 [Candidatus Kaiserbacteria bacterium]|nr:hypothetical protein [Candidatus Kaiserbacteria bacterium]
MEIYFAKLFGLYFIVIGAIILWRRKSVMPTVANLAANRGVLLALSTVEIAAGLALTIVFPSVTFSVSGVIGIIGYMIIIEGILYMASPSRVVQRFIKRFNKPRWFVSGGVLAIVVGAYLAAYGFAII